MSKNRSGIEEMRRRLYARGEKLSLSKRRNLRALEYDAKSGWKGNGNKTFTENSKKTRKSFLSTLLFLSFIFFIIALGFSSYFIINKSNIISSQNIDIKIEGPASIRGGEELSLQIAIANKNNVSIKFADMIIEYPDGTRSAADISAELPRFRETLGMLAPGEIKQKTVKAILLGSENTQQDIKVTIEYRIDGSRSIFFTERVYKVTITSSPLSLLVSALDEITSGQQVEFNIEIISNSNTLIKDAVLSVEYPFGFKFISSSPEASFTDSGWSLGDIQPEGKRNIKLRGIIVGEDEEERVFRFSSGVAREDDEKELGVTFITSMKSIVIKKPFVGIDIALNGDRAPEYISAAGDKIRADIIWTNNMPIKVSDAEIEVKLSGTALDKFSISADGGFYRSIDNTIIFSGETNSDLISINPGESGRATFSFASLGASSGNIFKNPEMFIDINIKGNRISEGQVSQKINSTLSRVVKLSSDLILTSRAVYFAGPFANTGAIPPKAESETTYTIIWTITNSSNIVDNILVTATLPSYIRWTGQTSPSDESIIFNPIGGKIVWDVGTVKPRSGILSEGQREVAFQVSFLPSIGQINSSPILVNEQEIIGLDRFTDKEISGGKKALTTQLSTDPSFPKDGANVAE